MIKQNTIAVYVEATIQTADSNQIWFKVKEKKKKEKT